MPNDSAGHTCAFDVIASDIDHMGHVNNTVYLRWIQEAVISFWHRIAPGDALESVARVAIKHEITYRCPAFLDQRVDCQSASKRDPLRRAAYRGWPRDFVSLIAATCIDSCLT